MFACVGGEEHTQAFQVFVVTQTAQRCVSREFVLAHGLEGAHGHLAGEKAWTNGVDRDVVSPPFAAQGAREVDHCPLGCVVGHRGHFARVAAQAGNRRHVDDAANATRNHAVFGDVLAQDEVAANVDIHDLVPGFNRVVFGRCAPGCAGIVDQNIDMAHAFDGFVAQRPDVGFFGAIGGNPVHVNPCGF